MNLSFLVLEDDLARIKAFRERFSELARAGHNVVSTIVGTSAGCIAALAREGPRYDFVLLDHDLDGKVMQDPGAENTGGEVADWVAADPERISRARVWITHSFNPAGRAYIVERIPGCAQLPALWMSSLAFLTEKTTEAPAE